MSWAKTESLIHAGWCTQGTRNAHSTSSQPHRDRRNIFRSPCVPLAANMFTRKTQHRWSAALFECAPHVASNTMSLYMYTRTMPRTLLLYPSTRRVVHPYRCGWFSTVSNNLWVGHYTAEIGLCRDTSIAPFHSPTKHDKGMSHEPQSIVQCRSHSVCCSQFNCGRLPRRGLPHIHIF